MSYDFDVVTGEAPAAKCAMSQMQNKGTEGRVYGGNPDMLHVPDGRRAELGHVAAAFIEGWIRENAENRTDRQKEMQPLCVGCTMVVMFNASIVTADDNGQSRKELARCMINAYQKLLDDPEAGLTEEIKVLLDPDDY